MYIYRLYLDEVAPVAHSDMEEMVRRYRLADPRERLHASVIRRLHAHEDTHASGDIEQRRVAHASSSSYDMHHARI